MARLRLPKPSQGMIVAISAAATVVVLFGVQEVYRSFAGADARRDRYAEFAARNEIVAEQRARLQRGRMPIDQAIRTLANERRDRLALIAPEASADPAPAAGWMHSPRYVDPASEPAGDAPSAPSGDPDDVPDEGGTEQGASDDEEPVDAAPATGDERAIEREAPVPPTAPPAAPRAPRGDASGDEGTADEMPAARRRAPNPRPTVPAEPTAPGQATP